MAVSHICFNHCSDQYLPLYNLLFWIYEHVFMLLIIDKTKEKLISLCKQADFKHTI